ncbi:hypothetical protein ETD83_20825 [Actinomadura soli]|uniref:Uncharacterized protein n=1 Tax=Actinomadura soli TaxID=2508997 RepID=A0A5C4JAX9_9ACTN|nr:hypothetical protein [Actinomadura soli]TMQ96803.1 hypothetical protein ETD83_20825 [Actinomadura soli]
MGRALEMIVAASTIISSTTAVIALLLVWFQLRTQSRQLRQVALAGLHEELLSAEMQRAIRAICQFNPQELEIPRSERILEQVELILNRYDLIGMRVKCRVIPKSQAISSEWQVVLRIDHQLRQFIDAERQRRNGGPYKPGFEWLVTEARNYKLRHYPDTQIRPFRRIFNEQRSMTGNGAT